MGVVETLLNFRGNAEGALLACAEVRDGLGEVKEKAEKTHGSLAATFGKAAVLGGAAAFVGILAKGTEAANEQEDAQVKLTQALKNAGWTASADEIKTVTDAQEKYGQTAAETMNNMAQLTAAHIPLSEQAKVLAAAQDLAAGTGLDFESSLKSVMMMAQGQSVRAMNQYGIQLPPVIDSTKQLTQAQRTLATDQAKLNDAVSRYGPKSKEAAAAQKTLNTQQDLVNQLVNDQKSGIGDLNGSLDALNGRFGGQGAAAAETFSGKLKSLGVIIHDKVFVPVGQMLLPKLDQLMDWITAHGPEIESDIVGAMQAVGSAIGVAVTVVGALLPVLGFLGDHMTAVKVVAIAILGPLLAFKAALFIEKKVTDAYNTVKDGFKAVQGAAKLAGDGISAAMDFGKAVAKATADFAVMVAKAAWAGAQMVASWVAQAAAATAAFVVEMAEALLDFGVMAAGAIATGIAMAAAFLLPLAPFILIGLAIAALVALVVTHFTQIKNFIAGVISGVVSFIKDHWQLLLAIFLGPLGIVIGFVITHFQQIKDIIGKVVGDVVVFFQGFATIVGNIWSGITTAIKNAFQNVIDFFSRAISTITGFFGGIGDGIKNAFKAAFNFIGAIWNSTVGSLSFTVPGWVPGLANDTFSMPKIPTFAKGASVSQATAAIFGEAGREHAVPDLAMDELLARAAQAGASARGGESHTTNVTINNPHSNVDVMQAMEDERRLDQLGARGIIPGVRPPMQAMPA